jgi:hypothetical protein
VILDWRWSCVYSLIIGIEAVETSIYYPSETRHTHRDERFGIIS